MYPLDKCPLAPSVGTMWQCWVAIVVLDIAYKFDFGQRRANTGDTNQFRAIMGSIG